MNYGAEPADQVVRYSLEGTEVALRLSGRAAVTFAKFVAAVLQDQKKTHGKTRLVRLLREGKCNLVRRTEKGRLRRRGWGLRWEKAQKGGKGTNLRGFFED